MTAGEYSRYRYKNGSPWRRPGKSNAGLRQAPTAPRQNGCAGTEKKHLNRLFRRPLPYCRENAWPAGGALTNVRYFRFQILVNCFHESHNQYREPSESGCSLHPASYAMSEYGRRSCVLAPEYQLPMPNQSIRYGGMPCPVGG